MNRMPPISHWLMRISPVLFAFHVGISWTQAEVGDLTSADAFADWSDSTSRSVIRFFQSQDQYHSGDLIVRSQVAEIQEYLRKTRGASSTTNPRLRKRVLADQDYLSRAFYAPGGNQILREAANEIGGYGPLDQLCQLKLGREILSTAIRQSNLEMLVEYIQSHESVAESVQVSSDHADKSRPSRQSGRPSRQRSRPSRQSNKIYTVEDLLQALHPDGIKKNRVRSQ